MLFGPFRYLGGPFRGEKTPFEGSKGLERGFGVTKIWTDQVMNDSEEGSKGAFLLFRRLQDVFRGLEMVIRGAVELFRGLRKVSKGLEKVSKGLGEVSKGLGEVSKGLKRSFEGSKRLSWTKIVIRGTEEFQGRLEARIFSTIPIALRNAADLSSVSWYSRAGSES
jgi:hypothetical protein